MVEVVSMRHLQYYNMVASFVQHIHDSTYHNMTPTRRLSGSILADGYYTKQQPPRLRFGSYGGALTAMSEISSDEPQPTSMNDKTMTSSQNEHYYRQSSSKCLCNRSIRVRRMRRMRRMKRQRRMNHYHGGYCPQSLTYCTEQTLA